MINEEFRNKELEIKQKYPNQFTSRAYLGIGPGWLGLFEELCESIQGALNKSKTNDSNFTWHQIKEKFGCLRVYYQYEGSDQNCSDQISEFVSIAEIKSGVACEVCGVPGISSAPTGWIRVLCDEHNTPEGSKLFQ